MQDIARRAGVTKAAVSFALNGHAGVSEPTRRRVLAIAHELGWQPSSAARALSDGRAGSFGLVIDRPAATLGIEPFFMRLLSGIQNELSRDNTPLLLAMAEDQEAELVLYRDWWARRLVDGVFLVDLQVDDVRVRVLQELGLPTVVIGAPLGTGPFPAVWSDDSAAMATAAAHLAELGHRRIARVSGPSHLRHTAIRDVAFRQIMGELGIEAVIVESDYTEEHGASATLRVMSAPSRPTALIYDNDVMALSGLAAVQSLGLDVPADVSIIAWDDSALCELVRPPLTALSRDIAAYAVHAARLLRQAAGGEKVGDLQDIAFSLNLRASTGPSPRWPRQAPHPYRS
ncbi:LacI family DNA-binding transcriptional regulator [Streptomyces sp. MAR4 CNY-716]